MRGEADVPFEFLGKMVFIGPGQFCQSVQRNILHKLLLHVLHSLLDGFWNNQFKGVTMATVLLTFAKIGLAFGVGFYKTAVTSVLGIYAILIVPQRWKIRFRK